jgi:hypothetical protein
MPQLQVTYDPQPIPWIVPHNFDGKQTGPGHAKVTLTVIAVDANSGAAVAAMVNSIPNPQPDLIEDPNDLSLLSNTPQLTALVQMTSFEIPPDPIYLPPGVKVTADGYDDAFLVLE